MKTYEIRLAQLRKLVDDPDLALTLKESLAQTYYWVRFEYALIAKDKAEARATKFADKYNENVAVFNFRKSMNDL